MQLLSTTLEERNKIKVKPFWGYYAFSRSGIAFVDCNKYFSEKWHQLFVDFFKVFFCRFDYPALDDLRNLCYRIVSIHIVPVIMPCFQMGQYRIKIPGVAINIIHNPYIVDCHESNSLFKNRGWGILIYRDKVPPANGVRRVLTCSPA